MTNGLTSPAVPLGFHWCSTHLTNSESWEFASVWLHTEVTLVSSKSTGLRDGDATVSKAKISSEKFVLGLPAFVC